MRTDLRRPIRSRRSGSALLVGMVVALAMGAMAFSLVAIGVSGTREQHGALEEAQAKYVCEAGLADALLALESGTSGDVGTEDLPQLYGGAQYWVDAAETTPNLIQLVATGRDDRAAERQELVVRRVIISMFTYGVFGEEDVHLEANALVDSYDSDLGTWLSQAVNSDGSDTWANTNGSIGSNQDVSLDQTASVYGSATPGPGGTTSILGTASVSGAITPAAELATFPPIIVPSFPMSGALTVALPTILPSGNYAFSQLQVLGNKQLIIVGPATIVCDSFDLDSGATITIDATNGGVEFYVMNDFTLDSNTTITSLTGTPKDVNIKLLSDNIIDPFVAVDLDEVDFDSNAKLYGTIYAPNALVEIDSNFEMFGALVAKEVDLDSNCKIHYDEALAEVDADKDFQWEVVSWRPLACDLD